MLEVWAFIINRLPMRIDLRTIVRPHCDVIAQVHSFDGINDIRTFQQLLVSLDICCQCRSGILAKFIEKGGFEVRSYLTALQNKRTCWSALAVTPMIKALDQALALPPH